MMMTDEEADELLRSNDWCKWSDARELLQTAAHMGAIAEREWCVAACEAQRINDPCKGEEEAHERAITLCIDAIRKV